MNLPFSVSPLDANFVAPKPINSPNMKKISALEAAGDLIITRKRDGYGSLSVFGNGDAPAVYSLNNASFSDRVPHLVEALGDIGTAGTTLIGAELIMPTDESDNLPLVTKIMKSKPGLARELQEEYGPMRMRLFNVLIADGQDVTSEPFHERLERITAYAAQAREHLDTVEVLDTCLTGASALSRKEDWEGLVVYDRNATSAFRLDGKFSSRPRPQGCWKVKPFLEDDFVARGFRISEAKSHAGMVKDLEIGQYHPDTGEFISCGYVGNIPRPMREKLLDRSLYPFVLTAKYERRFDSGKLRTGHIIELFREDKPLEECVFPREYLPVAA